MNIEKVRLLKLRLIEDVKTDKLQFFDGAFLFASLLEVKSADILGYQDEEVVDVDVDGDGDGGGEGDPGTDELELAAYNQTAAGRRGGGGTTGTRSTRRSQWGRGAERDDDAEGDTDVDEGAGQGGGGGGGGGGGRKRPYALRERQRQPQTPAEPCLDEGLGVCWVINGQNREWGQRLEGRGGDTLSCCFDASASHGFVN
ncbi:hypothetical protein F5880DRAFT_1618919 [Lentinula raphanica]|nr:hypothetical protein F5880DRAFT_1618919 [Lentinula raphanica]